MCVLTYDLNGERVIFFEFKSEQALDVLCPSYKVFPPGHYLTFSPNKEKSSALTRYFQPEWFNESFIPASLESDGVDVVENVDYVTLRRELENAVRKRLMSDVPYGVLLSGLCECVWVRLCVCV